MTTPSPDLDESAAAKAARELPALQAKTELVRAELEWLEQAVVNAGNRLSGVQSSRLIEANEQLVLALLCAQSDADSVGRTLKEMSRTAELDVLTELPNRTLLLDRFERAIVNAKRSNTKLALLFLDINNFKHINDTLGHAVGDRVLKRVADCLATTVRGADTVSRHCGDEFLILLTEISHAKDAVIIAEKISASLNMPHLVGEHELRLTASIGISIYPDDGENALALIDSAGAAMYDAKRRRITNLVFPGTAHINELDQQAGFRSEQGLLIHHQLALAEHERWHLQLREANEQLVLAALSAQALQAAAEQAQRRQTEFLAVLAHELRSPLTPIRTAAAVLGRTRAEEPLLPRVQAVIERQVAHMSRLVDDLLDVSRVHTGKLRLERQVINMADVLEAAIDASRPAMDTRLQHFGAYVPKCVLDIDGDPVRLTQVMTNLLENASKYTPDGGEIALSVVVVGDAMVITVSDTGIGIAADALSNVFEPFVQDAHAVGFNGFGLGIGLTVVRELVEAHGGSVVAISPGLGLGSQFVVTLPLHSGKPLSADRV